MAFVVFAGPNHEMSPPPNFGFCIAGLPDFVRSVLSTNFWLGARSISVLKVLYPGRVMEKFAIAGGQQSGFCPCRQTRRCGRRPQTNHDGWPLGGLKPRRLSLLFGTA